MLSAGKSPTDRIKSILLQLELVVALVTRSVICQNEGTYITIPALGRHARLGFLYDERTDKFLGMNVFKEPVTGVSVTTTDRYSTSLKSHSIENNADKFNLFGIKGEIELNIYLNQITVKGSAEYLQEDTRSAHEVTGMMLCEITTAVEDLQIYYDELTYKYNIELVNEEGATHIVTEIKWGGSVAIQFSQKVSEESDKTHIKGELQLAFKNPNITIEVNGSASVTNNRTNSHKTSNFFISVRGDMMLPNQTPTTATEVHELIQQAPGLTRQANGGKGTPVEFTLTPIGKLRKHLKQNPKTNDFAKKLEQEILDDFITIFESISEAGQKINDLLEEFRDNFICITPLEYRNLTELRKSFLASKIKFQSQMKEVLIAVRSGSGEHNKMMELAKTYSENQFSPGEITEKLHAFNATVEKIKQYKTILKDYPNVTYFGHLSNLDASLLSNLKKVVYILFNFPARSESDIKLKQENYHLFFVSLNKPLHKLFVVDCDFKFWQCNNLDRTVIQHMVNGITNMKDVNEELKLQKLSNLLKMKALGRYAEMGQLYDIRTNTFLPDNIFKSELPQILIQKTKNDRVETEEILSETIKGKFKALNVEPDLQYSILGDLFQWSRSGMYFAKEEFGISSSLDKSKCPARSFFHIRSLSEETVSLKDKNIRLKYFAADALSKGATHCVVTIEYGFLFIFQAHTMVQDDFKINNKYLNWKNYERECAKSDLNLKSFTTKLMKILNRIRIPEANTSYNFSNILSPSELQMLYGSGSFSVKVYSDIQGPDSPPKMISSTDDHDDLQYFLSKMFIREQMKNGGKGVPIAYALYPLDNLIKDAGIIPPYIPYQQLSSHTFDPFNVVDIFDELSLAKNQVDELLMIMSKNADCIEDQDLILIKTIDKDFDLTIGKLQNQFINYIRHIKSGEKQLEMMKRLLMKYKSTRVFDNNRRYLKLQYVNNATEKISVCIELKKKGVTYFGRKSAGNSFNDVFEKLEASPFYVFYYNYSWKKTHVELWRGNVAFFLNLVKNKYQNLFVVNCEFEDEPCKNVTRPVIHQYARGLITSYDYSAIVKAENQTIVPAPASAPPFPEGTDLSLNKRIKELEESLFNELSNVGNIIDSLHSCKNAEAYIPPSNGTIDFQTLDCGGVVNLPAGGHTLFLKYKFSGNPGEEQRCLWTINTYNDQTVLYLNEINIFLFCDKLGSSSDLLAVYGWSPYEDSDISYTDLRTSARHLSPTSFGRFLYFNTKSSAPPGTEFILQVDVLDKHKIPYGGSIVLNWSFNNTEPGAVNYNLLDSLVDNRNSACASITVVPPKTQGIQFTVEELDFPVSCGKRPVSGGADAVDRYDGLDVYALEERGMPKLLQRVCGNIISPIQLYTEYPIIAVASERHTENKENGRCKVSWK